MNKKGWFLAILVLGFAAAPAFASVQNVKVSGDIETTWLVRDQFDLGHQNQNNQFYQNLLITQTRLRIDAELTDNVSAAVRLINERAWNVDSSDSNDIDLNLAYVELREMLYSPLTVIIGRQEFAYGNSFVIDSAGTNNVIGESSGAGGGLKGVAEDLTKRTALDAIRAILNYDPITIDLVAAKVDANNLDGTGAHDDDVDLFGTNINYQLGDDMNTVIESYFWAKIDQSNKTSSGSKGDTVYMPGVRVGLNPIENLSVSVEFAAQFGRKFFDSSNGGPTNVKRRALGGQIIANYALPIEPLQQYSPVLTTSYTYVSGESDPTRPDRYYEAWDPMFENQNGGTIANALFDQTNVHVITTALSVKPKDDLTATLQYVGIWLDKEVTDSGDSGDGNCSGTTDCLPLRQPDGTLIDPNMTSNLKLWDEVDVMLVWDYTEDVQFGVTYGLGFPGNAFDDSNNKVASQVLVNGKVTY